MTRPVALVTVTADELRALVHEAVALALAADRSKVPALGESLSLTQAARRVKRRTADVAAALNAGELKGRLDGRRWRIRAADLATWADGA